MISVPQIRVTIVASDKKGPKGIPSFLVFFFRSKRIIATSPPRIIPPKTATNTLGNPHIRPISPAIFTWPRPMPVLLMTGPDKEDEETDGTTEKPEKEAMKTKLRQENIKNNCDNGD